MGNEWLVTNPLSETLSTLKRSLNLNLPQAMMPTYEYWHNNFAQGVPWRAPMDWLLSGYLYVLLALAVIVGILVLKGPRGSWLLLRRYGWLIALYLMIAGTIGLQNRDDWSEANRLKVFLEIPVWLAATYFVHLIGVRLNARRSRTESIAA